MKSFEPINKLTRQSEVKDDLGSITKFNGFELLQRKLKVVPTLLEPILPQKGLIGLVGSSDSGKSTLLRQLCIYIVLGIDYVVGYKNQARHHRAIYVSTEDGDAEISYLLGKQAQGLGFDESLFRNLEYIFDYGDNLIATLDHELSKKPTDLVVIDAFGDIYGGNLNDTHGVRSFLKPLQDLANRHECLFILLHHTSKRSEEKPPNKSNVLGAQGFEAKMRLVIELRRDYYEPSLRHLCFVKGNYLPDKYKNASVVLRFEEENMLFKNTGESVPFEQLIKPTENSTKGSKFSDDEVVELYKKEKSLRKVGEQLSISKSQVQRVVNRNRET